MLLSIFNEISIFELSFALKNWIICCFSWSTSIEVVLFGTEYIIVLSSNSGSEILSIDAIIYLPLSSWLLAYSTQVSVISFRVIFLTSSYSSLIFSLPSTISFSFSMLLSDRVDVSKSVRFISATGFDFFWTFTFDLWELKTWLWNVETGINLYLNFFFYRLTQAMKFLI